MQSEHQAPFLYGAMVFPLTSQFPLRKQAAEGCKDLALAAAGTGPVAYPPGPVSSSLPRQGVRELGETGRFPRREKMTSKRTLGRFPECRLVLPGRGD